MEEFTLIGGPYSGESIKIKANFPFVKMPEKPGPLKFSKPLTSIDSSRQVKCISYIYEKRKYLDLNKKQVTFLVLSTLTPDQASIELNVLGLLSHDGYLK